MAATKMMVEEAPRLIPRKAPEEEKRELRTMFARTVESILSLRAYSATVSGAIGREVS